MVGWHHRFKGHEFEQTPRHIVEDREAWYSAVHGVAVRYQESDITEQLNNYYYVSETYTGPGS